MDDKQELRLRRKALRLRLKGIPHQVILAKVQRSRAWLSKWQDRFDRQGAAGLHSHSRQPQHTPTACSPRIVRLIVQTRRRLVKQPVGLIGVTPRVIVIRSASARCSGRPRPTDSPGLGQVIRSASAN